MAEEKAPELKQKEELGPILARSLKRAAEGGISGAAAMSINVLTLMWMRTTVNYQYRYGTNMMTAFRTLYKDGGIPRFYRGLVPALLQGPLSRFGDTAANTGTLAALDNISYTADLPVAFKTVAASVAAGSFRILLMPIDTIKTTMQVEGKDGLQKVFAKARVSGPTTFFHGALAAATATFVGHYPWFFVYNYLSATLPKYDDLPRKLLRSAGIGFCASALSDTCSNSIRVIKVYKQSSTVAISYPEAIRRVIAEDGVLGLMGRGLSTKIMSNGVQGLTFSVLWKLIDENFFKDKDGGDKKSSRH